MKKLLFVAVLFVTQVMVAQIQDGWVFFADKEDVAASIANPISILTQDAIDRKQMHGIAIDERDVPVNESYITQIKNSTGITVRAKSKWMNCVYVVGTQANIENLLNLPFVTDVEFADKDLNRSPLVRKTKKDKFTLEETASRIVYNYGAALNQTEMIAADFLHEEDFTGEGMVIAVLDSGFPNVNSNVAFADIVSEGRLLGTYDFAERQINVDGTGNHGAKTFSDMGAFIQNQFVGTAPKASYYLFRTEFAPTETPVEEAWWVEALERADSLGVDVTNTSLGYQDYDNPNYDHSYEDLDGQTTFAARGANLAFEKGMIIVTSAGNDGGGFSHVATPGDAIGAFTIGSVDPDGSYSSFSSIGPTFDGRIKPDVMAQGRDAAVIDQNGNVTFNNGTSFSSPIMAGAVACLWQARPEVRNSRVMQVIREAAHLFNSPTNEMGYGIPNFEDAYNALLVLDVEEESLKSQFAIYPNPVITKFNISFPQGIEQATVVVFNLLGTEVLRTEVQANANALDISNLAAGMYIANISSNEKTNSFKIIKR